MRIVDAISRVDALYFNTFSNDEKVAWLAKLDGLILEQVIAAHEGAEKVCFSGYDPLGDLQTRLLVDAPYDEMYIPWLQAQMELALRETEGYNAAITTFNAEYGAFVNSYNRSHMPKSHGIFRY